MSSTAFGAGPDKPRSLLWPPEKVGELVGRLSGDLHISDPQTEAAWKTEIDRRIEEIQTGKVQGLPAEEVFEKARLILGR